jgi:hypothetical protein
MVTRPSTCPRWQRQSQNWRMVDNSGTHFRSDACCEPISRGDTALSSSDAREHGVTSSSSMVHLYLIHISFWSHPSLIKSSYRTARAALRLARQNVYTSKEWGVRQYPISKTAKHHSRRSYFAVEIRLVYGTHSTQTPCYADTKGGREEMEPVDGWCW